MKITSKYSVSALTVKFSDTVIARYLKDETVSQLRDPRYPLRLRFNKARTRGSWFIVSYKGGKDIWKKVASYPAETFKDISLRLTDLCAAANDGKGVATVNEWGDISGLLGWYGDRIASSRNTSPQRKRTIASAIKCHLLPKLGRVLIGDIDHTAIDSKLMQCMQSEYSPAHVESVWKILNAAFNQALKLKKIASNPLEKMKWSDFFDRPVASKGAALRPHEISSVFESLVEQKPEIKFFVVMMLLYGTRIGETRLALWRNLDEHGRVWHIPASDTKTKEAHRLPLSDLAIQFIDEYRLYQEGRKQATVYLFTKGNKKALSSNSASSWVRDAREGKWTAHDLRKLAKTAWADIGIDHYISERLLNHKMSNLDITYNYSQVEKQKITAIEAYHGWLIDSGINTLLTKTTPRFSEKAESLKDNDSGASSNILVSTRGEDNK